MAMDLSGAELVVSVLLRWLDILGIVLFLGSLGFRQLTLLPALHSLDSPASRKTLLRGEDAQLEGLLRRLLLFLAGVHLFSLLFQLGLESAWRLSGLALAARTSLLEGRFGWLWTLKILLLAGAFKLFFSSRWSPKLLFGIGLLLCLLGSLGGHALAPGVHYLFLTDWLHFSAVSVWVGGLMPLRGLAARSRKCLPGQALAAFLARTVECFSLWAILCVMTIVITGGFNAMVYLGTQGFVFQGGYESVLLAKLVFVLAAFALGGFSRVYILPRLQQCAGGSPREAPRLARLFCRALAIETGFACLVLVLASLLTRISPPQLLP